MSKYLRNANFNEKFDNRTGTIDELIDSPGNYFGDVIEVRYDGKTFLNVMCGCGGSGYLCRKCAERLIASSNPKCE